MHFTKTMSYYDKDSSINEKCKGCRYYVFFEEAFGVGYAGCSRLWYKRGNVTSCNFSLSEIPDTIKANCIAYEQKTIFSWLKPKKPLVDITEDIITEED